MRIVIVGAGNWLLSDEGFGVHVVKYLAENYEFPDEVEIFDAGTLGLSGAYALESADAVYVVDAVNGEGRPGEIRLYDKEHVMMLDRIPGKLSPHQLGIREMLLVTQLRGKLPAELVLFGVIPVSLGPGIVLSPLVEISVKAMAQMLIADLLSRGLSIRNKTVTATGNFVDIGRTERFPAVSRNVD
jgi:hydrogenase maturation protease